jgi:hypothetical protein
MAEYNRKQALIGILNRPSLEEQMKKNHTSDYLDSRLSKQVPSMKVIYSKEEEKARIARFFALSDHLD